MILRLLKKHLTTRRTIRRTNLVSRSRTSLATATARAVADGSAPPRSTVTALVASLTAAGLLWPGFTLAQTQLPSPPPTPTSVAQASYAAADNGSDHRVATAGYTSQSGNETFMPPVHVAPPNRRGQTAVEPGEIQQVAHFDNYKAGQLDEPYTGEPDCNDGLQEKLTGFLAKPLRRVRTASPKEPTPAAGNSRFRAAPRQASFGPAPQRVDAMRGESIGRSVAPQYHTASRMPSPGAEPTGSNRQYSQVSKQGYAQDSSQLNRRAVQPLYAPSPEAAVAQQQRELDQQMAYEQQLTLERQVAPQQRVAQEQRLQQLAADGASSTRQQRYEQNYRKLNQSRGRDGFTSNRQPTNSATGLSIEQVSLNTTPPIEDPFGDGDTFSGPIAAAESFTLELPPESDRIARRQAESAPRPQYRLANDEPKLVDRAVQTERSMSERVRQVSTSQFENESQGSGFAPPVYSEPIRDSEELGVTEQERVASLVDHSILKRQNSAVGNSATGNSAIRESAPQAFVPNQGLNLPSNEPVVRGSVPARQTSVMSRPSVLQDQESRGSSLPTPPLGGFQALPVPPTADDEPAKPTQLDDRQARPFDPSPEEQDDEARARLNELERELEQKFKDDNDDSASEAGRFKAEQDRPVLKSCDDFRRELLGSSIRDISLDVSPLAGASRDQYDTVSRSWTDRNGFVIAEGSMVDLRRGYVIIDGINGRIKIPYARLSEGDWAAIAEYWRIPALCSYGTGGSVERHWAPQTFTWKASSLCHKPLFFENIQLERYGHSHGPISQPFHSVGHFFRSLVMVPYQSAITPANECQYALGFYRPGDCAPWLKDPVPISLNAARRQALVATGLAFIP